MTERDWLACEYPQAMLAWLKDDGRWSGRKGRLFACACVRRVWPLLPGPGDRVAVEVAEWYADGRAGVDDLAAALPAVLDLHRHLRGYASAARSACWHAACDREAASHLSPAYAGPQAEYDGVYASHACHHALQAAVGAAAKDALKGDRRAASAVRSLKEAAGQAQAALVRDVFGNPFDSRPPLDPSLLEWSDGLVRRLAQAAYDDRQLPEGTLDGNLLAILADALEEAGCTYASLLGHLRSPGPHVRGCFAIDWLLGKG